MSGRMRVGISRCLLGDSVRYDGGHQHDRFLTDTLGQYVDYVPVCPEVECGLSVPREPLRLVGDPESPRLITVKTGVDHTGKMSAWARKRVRELGSDNLCGFIFKSNSPSSGMQRVKVYSPKGMPVKKGVGLFARAFMNHFPSLPVEEDKRLNDPAIRENFIEAIFALKRWRESEQEKRNLDELTRFHTSNKMLIRSHSEKHYREMGRMVAEGKKSSLDELYRRYETHLLAALRLKTTVKKNTNVLQHAMGYFKKQLTADEKQELLEMLDSYRTGHLPLVVPITLIKHYVRKYDQSYLMQQTYLDPHPLELRLRNHS